MMDAATGNKTNDDDDNQSYTQEVEIQSKKWG